MAVSLAVTSITQDAQGRVNVQFSDQTGMVFPSKAVALAWVQNLDQLNDEAAQLLKRLILAWWIARDPTGATPATVLGKTVTINLTGSPILSVT